MIQAGYMYKRIALPEGLNCENVIKVYSVGQCISKDFADYIPFWKHNKYWFFNNPGDMDKIIDEQNIASEFELLFYELYEMEFDEQEGSWQEFTAGRIIWIRGERARPEGFPWFRYCELFAWNIPSMLPFIL